MVTTFKEYKELRVELHNKILVVKFNNPKKKNCINQLGYIEITRALEQAKADNNITIVVLTGTGDYFSSGNDLSQASQIDDIESYVKKSNDIFERLIIAFIECPKIIVSLVNGPSIGVAATMVGLSDIAWATDNAYFVMPFTKLALVPEGCSSYLLPRIVGKSKANEMLLFSEKLTAQQAYEFSYVSRIYKESDLETEIWPKLHECSMLPPGSLLTTKKVINSQLVDTLRKVNKTEATELYKRFFAEETVQAMVNFAMRKQKAKL